MAEQEVEFHPVVVLTKYFTWASYMRGQFEGTLSKLTESDAWDDPVSINRFMFMSFWYASLYTVIEGWHDLNLTDTVIDGLLNSPNVELLKRYRHGVFHFQRTYFDPKYMPFLTATGSVEWVRSLHRAFFRYFGEWYKTHDLQGLPKSQ